LINAPVQKQKERSILVTGGTGFLGSSILDALWNAGFTALHAVSRGIRTSLLPEVVRRDVKWHLADLSDGGAVEDILSGIQAVVHAAGPSPFDSNNGKQQIRMLQQGTENLVNLSLDLGVKHFVHISSVAALGIRKREECITEEQIYSHSRFDSPFGLAKFMAEQTIWRAHAEGLPVSVLNPGYVLGAGDWHYSSPSLMHWLAQKPFFYPVGRTAWVGSRDVAQAVVKLLEGEYTGQRCILSADNLPFHQVFNLIAAETGVDAPSTAFSPTAKFLLATMKAMWPRMFSERFFFYNFLGESLFADASYSSDLSKHQLGIRYTSIRDVISEVGALSRKNT